MAGRSAKDFRGLKVNVTGARLTVLSSDEVETVTNATFQLLESTGVLVREPRAHRLLLSAGAIGTPGRNVYGSPKRFFGKRWRKFPESGRGTPATRPATYGSEMAGELDWGPGRHVPMSGTTIRTGSGHLPSRTPRTWSG